MGEGCITRTDAISICIGIIARLAALLVALGPRLPWYGQT